MKSRLSLRMAAVILPVAPIVLAGACLLAAGCGVSSSIEPAGQGGDPGGTGGESTGGGSGGASEGMGGSGAGGTPCTPPTSGVMVDGVSRFQFGINYAWASFARWTTPRVDQFVRSDRGACEETATISPESSSWSRSTSSRPAST